MRPNDPPHPRVPGPHADAPGGSGPDRRVPGRPGSRRVVALVLGGLLLAVGTGALVGPVPAALAGPGATEVDRAVPAETEGTGSVGAAPEPEATATAPVLAPTPAPTPSTTADPTTAPTAPGTPTGPPAPTPTPEPEATPTGTPAPSPAPTAGTGTGEESGTSGTVHRPATPPAAVRSTTPWAQLLTALAVVAAGAVAVVVLSARRARAEAAQTALAAQAGRATEGTEGTDGAGVDGTGVGGTGADGTAVRPSADDVLRLLVEAGEAMVDAGHTVSSVADTLAEIAEAHDFADAETVVLPTALLVSLPHGGAVATAAVSTGRAPLQLYQLDALADVLRDASETVPAPAAPRALADRIRLLRVAPAPFGTLARLGGYLLLSVGLAALLGGSWVDFLVAGALGLAVGAVQLAAPPSSSSIEVIGTVVAAFGVTAVVLLLARVVPDLGVPPSIIAPLALFLPGGLLTTGVLELATGQMLSGAGRLAAGTMQLAVLAGGIVAGAALVGVPEIDLGAGDQPLGPLAPWAGVVLFGVGTVLFRCGRPRTTGWVMLVLGVAYGAQVIGGVLVGGVLSAFVGALAMTPVALAVARFPSGPSPLASFLPAFWMLVPGALGLLGVATLLDGDATGLSTLVTTAVTMLAIALGVLVGLAVSQSLPGGRGGAGRAGAGLPGAAIARRPRT